MALDLTSVAPAVGRRLYKTKEPEGNILVKITACIYHAIKRKITSSEKKKHWLDYAEDMYDNKIISDTKSVLTLIRLFMPLTVFFALYEQIGSRWTYQATRMDGEVFGFLMKPDQFITFNILLFLIILILSDWIIYPIIEKFLYINTPLRKITTGGLLAATAFVMSGVLELKLESTYVVQPSVGFGQIRIFNTINCPANLSLNGQNYSLPAFGVYQNLSIPVIGNKSLEYALNVTCPPKAPLNITGSIDVVEEKALSYLLRNDGLGISLPDKIDKSESGDPMIRALILTDTGAPANLTIQLNNSQDYQLEQHGSNFFTDFIEVKHSIYNISIGKIQTASGIPLRIGGVYTILGRVSYDRIPQMNVTTIVQPNSIHMFWLLPQYFVITLGEAMFFVTGQVLAYVEAPHSMKSLAQAIWLFNSAIGNLYIVIITKVNFFHRQAFEFFLYAGLMYMAMLIFIIMAIFYKYVNDTSPEHSLKHSTNMKSVNTKQGIENDSYSTHL